MIIWTLLRRIQELGKLGTLFVWHTLSTPLQWPRYKVIPRRGPLLFLPRVDKLVQNEIFGIMLACFHTVTGQRPGRAHTRKTVQKTVWVTVKFTINSPTITWYSPFAQGSISRFTDSGATTFPTLTLSARLIQLGVHCASRNMDPQIKTVSFVSGEHSEPSREHGPIKRTPPRDFKLRKERTLNKFLRKTHERSRILDVHAWFG